METVVIMFKNGKELRINCDNFEVTTNGLNQLTNIKWVNGTNINLLHIEFSEIMCIYQEIKNACKNTEFVVEKIK